LGDSQIVRASAHRNEVHDCEAIDARALGLLIVTLGPHLEAIPNDSQIREPHLTLNRKTWTHLPLNLSLFLPFQKSSPIF